MPDLPHALTPEDCLVAIMIAVSFSDEQIRTSELVAIERDGEPPAGLRHL